MDDPAEAIAVLYVLPVALVAVRFGTAGGVAAAGCALALFAVVNLITDQHVGALGYITRSVAYFTLGGLLGSFSTACATPTTSCCVTSSSSRPSSTTAPRSST